MKLLSNVKNKFVLAVCLIMVNVEAFAQAQPVDLTNLSGTSGAGTKQITDLTAKGVATANNIANFVLVIASLAGLILCASSVWAIYKASKDDRESPKTAIVGIFVGAAMTIISIILGIVRNFYSV